MASKENFEKLGSIEFSHRIENWKEIFLVFVGLNEKGK